MSMKDILANLALIDLNNFCKENNIDCSDTYLLKRAREYTYDLMRKGKPIVSVTFTKSSVPIHQIHKN